MIKKEDLIDGDMFIPEEKITLVSCYDYHCKDDEWPGAQSINDWLSKSKIWWTEQK